MASIAHRSANALSEEVPAVQSLPAILTIGNVVFSRTTRIAARMLRRVAGERASRALALLRQHFLKQDAVFSTVLVYSGCSAFRFPSARSDKVISYRRATWPRKQRRRRRRRAQ